MAQLIVRRLEPQVLAFAVPGAVAESIDCNGNGIPDDVDTLVAFDEHLIFEQCCLLSVHAVDLPGRKRIQLLRPILMLPYFFTALSAANLM